MNLNNGKIGSISSKLDIVFLVIAILSYFYFTYNNSQAPNSFGDLLFVTLLLGASTFLVMAFWSMRKYVAYKGFFYWSHVIQECNGEHIEHAQRHFLERVYNSLGRVFCGLFYAAVFVFAVNKFDYVKNMDDLRLAFGVFAFSVNYITGAALYSLVSFLFLVPALIRNIPIKVWDTKNPASEFLFNTTIRIGIYLALYVSTCMTSVLFSGIPTDFVVIAYILFSIATVCVSLLLPMYYYAKKIREFKMVLLQKIYSQLDSASEAVIGAASHGHKLSSVERMRDLVQLQQWISNIGVVPFIRRTTVAALTIALAVSPPYFVDLLIG